MASFWGMVHDTQHEYSADVFEHTKQRISQRDAMLLNKIEQLQALLQDRPCAWVPDEDRTECFACHAIFTLFRRRHHCRACGEVFDHQCTSKSKILNSYPKMGEQRVCDACFEAKPASSRVDFTTLAGVLTGHFGVVEDEEPVSVCRDDFAVEVIKTIVVAGPSVVVAPAVVEVATITGQKTRSEIPVPPPLPQVIPNMVKRPCIVLPTNLTLKKKPAAATTAAQQPGKMELGDIQNGLKSLRKAAPLTPAQRTQQDAAAYSDFQLSMRKRRLAVEGSPQRSPCHNLTNNCNNTSATKTNPIVPISISSNNNNGLTAAASSRYLLESMMTSVKQIECKENLYAMSTTTNNSFAC